MCKKVVCVIVTYNAVKWIEKCISTIQEEDLNLKIIVIDNNSSDNTVSIIKDKFPFVELYLCESNLGFGAANNIGYQKATEYKADYIYLLNQDTISYTNNIFKLITLAESNNKFGVVSPIHLNDYGDKLDLNFEEYITSKTCKEYISDASLGNLKPYYEIGFVNAAAWLIKMETIDSLGGLFSKAFFHYGEDVNFIGRLRFFNYKNVIVPGVYIHHCREERKGELSKEYLNKAVDINKKTIMLDIKLSFKQCHKYLFRYSIQQLMLFKINNFFKIVSYPILSYNTIIKYRESYKKRIKIL
jgi:GT2 family glycosyltransferase